MSTSLNINKPSWSSARPEEFTFDLRVDENVSNWLRNILIEQFVLDLPDGIECHSMKPVDRETPIGNIRVRSCINPELNDWFVRLAMSLPAEELDQIYGTADYLYKSECAVQKWIGLKTGEASFYIDTSTFRNPVLVSVSRFKEMSLITPETGVLVKSGEEVARLHKALSKVPKIDKIRDLTVKRIYELSKTKEALKNLVDADDGGEFGERFVWIKNNLDYINRLIDSYIPSLLIYKDMNVQPVHGDLNAGNILKLENSNLIILDFEDTRHSYFPRLADIAVLIQRLILFDEPDAEMLQMRLHAFFEGYMKLEPSPFAKEGPGCGIQLAQMLRQVNYYATSLLLTICRQGGLDFGDAEWDKFRLLEEQALRYGPLLNGFKLEFF